MEQNGELKIAKILEMGRDSMKSAHEMRVKLNSSILSISSALVGGFIVYSYWISLHNLEIAMYEKGLVTLNMIFLLGGIIFCLWVWKLLEHIFKIDISKNNYEAILEEIRNEKVTNAHLDNNKQKIEDIYNKIPNRVKKVNLKLNSIINFRDITFSLGVILIVFLAFIRIWSS